MTGNSALLSFIQKISRHIVGPDALKGKVPMIRLLNIEFGHRPTY